MSHCLSHLHSVTATFIPYKVIGLLFDFKAGSSEMQENGDELLITAAAELVVALVQTAGKEYSQVWRQEHWAIALDHLKPSKPSAVRAAAMGEYQLHCQFAPASLGPLLSNHQKPANMQTY